MLNSILNKISTFIKENNIKLKGLHYNFSDSFPSAFYDTIINYLQRANPGYPNHSRINDFYIGFDDNKNAYFEFLGSNEKTRVIVFSDDIRYVGDFPPAKVVKESIFLENVKNLDNARNSQIINSLPTDFLKRYVKKETEIKPLEEYFELITTQIIEYIDYLEKQYELLKKELDEAKEIEKIYFIESESSTNLYRIKRGIPNVHHERKNSEISFEERKAVLDNYPSEETFEARASNTNTTYYVKVFKQKEKCKLVMEPIEGNKYTKIVHLDYDKLSKGTVREIVIDSLQLNREETTNTKEITRHTHTTIEEYKKLLEYLLNEKDLGISYSTKKRIAESSETKIR